MTLNDSNRGLLIAGLTVLLLSGAAVFAWFAWNVTAGPTHLPEAEPEAPSQGVEAPPDPPAIASVNVEVQTPEAAGVAPEDCIAYPDGTRLPPLNGVAKAPRVAFHRLIPYTKIIGKRTDANGVEWYVHENGVWSTTRYQMRDGKQEAVGEVMMPVAPAGVVDK